VEILKFINKPTHHLFLMSTSTSAVSILF